MADLIVLGFDNEDTAEAVRTLSAKLMQEHRGSADDQCAREQRGLRGQTGLGR